MNYVTKSGLRIITPSTSFNCVLVVGQTTGIIVDTGTKKGLRGLVKLLEAYGHIDFRFVVLTHGHRDHVENLLNLVPIVSGGVVHHKLERLEGISPLHVAMLERTICTDFDRPDLAQCLKDLDIDILHTPGHTPGSISLIVDHEVAIVGDALGRGKELLPSMDLLRGLACKIYMPAHGNKIWKWGVDSE